MTELGVYILGAMALGILAAAGLSIPGAQAAAMYAGLAAAAGYVAQFGAAIIAEYDRVGVDRPLYAKILNLAGLICSCAAWVAGFAVVMGAV